MTETERVAEIAEKLTKAQRANLAALPDSPEVWATVAEMRPRGATGSGMDVLHVFYAPRLCDRVWTRWGNEPGQKAGEGYEYRITPLGLAVRAHLEAGDGE